MKFVFVIIAVISLLGMIMIFGAAKSAVHEIEGILAAICFIVSFGFAAIIDTVERHTSFMKKLYNRR